MNYSMMKKEFRPKGFWLLWLWLVGTVPLWLACPVQAKETDTKLTKHVSQSYKAEKDVTVDVSNKYGQVIINTWQKDSVKVEVEITAHGKNDDNVEKALKRIDLDFKQSGNFITLETVLD